MDEELGGDRRRLNPAELWAAVLGELEVQVTRPTFQTWLRDTAGAECDGRTLTVRVPSAFAAEWLEKRMYRLIQSTVERLARAPLEVRFQVGAGGAAGSVPLPLEDTRPAGSCAPGPAAVAFPNMRLNERYTFSTFVIGPSNQLAYSAAGAVAEAPGKSYNPLFIYSGVGLGKTHLLHAICHEARRTGRSYRYVTTEQFTNEFIGAIRDRTTEEFRARYRSPDLLVVDDIQFIGGKEQTQEGFFHTFNDLHNSSRQIVITSDRPPKALSLLEDRLRSRFEWGLIADIQPPDLETRMAILRSKAAHLNLNIDDNVVEFLARKVQKNVRELEGSLNRLQAFIGLTGAPATVETVERALADILVAVGQRSSPEQVLHAVSSQFGVTFDALTSRRRDRGTAQARQVAMYLLREELDLSLTDIGRLLGGKDHTTVAHAVGKINYDINVDDALRREVLGVKDRLAGPVAAAA